MHNKLSININICYHKSPRLPPRMLERCFLCDHLVPNNLCAGYGKEYHYICDPRAQGFELCTFFLFYISHKIYDFSQKKHCYCISATSSARYDSTKILANISKFVPSSGGECAIFSRFIQWIPVGEPFNVFRTQPVYKELKPLS